MRVRVQALPEDAEATHLRAECEVRYWEDAEVDGVEDGDGTRIPCRNGDLWSPLIALATGRIENWTPGVSAKIHYKICDAGRYALLDADGEEIVAKSGYVPKIMAPGGSHFGDYVIMTIGPDGVIEKWHPDVSHWEG